MITPSNLYIALKRRCPDLDLDRDWSPEFTVPARPPLTAHQLELLEAGFEVVPRGFTGDPAPLGLEDELKPTQQQ